ncbi:MAG: DUF2752 domain-containing protein [Oscillospiraceae bacterium]|nr:DUF2752 domain-containing protein [Oscillospiraceae bacterium]
MDAAVVPGIYVCRWLLQKMLDRGEPCKWTFVGAKCATCGGTHCVQSFLQGDLAASFVWNPMVFCWILYAIATGVLLNLRYVFHLRWAEHVLKGMYSLRVFYVGLGVFLLYTLVRNAPLLWNLLF